MPADPQPCAKRGCHNRVTQAWDVGSWWRRAEPIRHYEVCDEHAHYFTGNFDREASERVERDLEYSQQRDKAEEE